MKAECRGCWGLAGVQKKGKYLGLPYIIGRSKKTTLDYVKERVANKVKGWSGKPVNLAGKGVLAKSVLLTMPLTGMCKMLTRL